MKGKPSFSILSLILLTTIVALAAALFSLNRKLAMTEKKVKVLEEYADAISVDDPACVYVRPLDRDAPMTFAYKLALPAGRNFNLKVGEGVGDNLDVIYLETVSGVRDRYIWPEQYDRAIYLRKKNQTWFVGGRRNMGSPPFNLKDRNLDWMEGLSITSLAWNSVVSTRRDQTSHDANERIYLVDFDENSVPNPFARPKITQKRCENPRRFAIWLEPVSIAK